MKPGTRIAEAARADRHGRGVRVFVALHVAAVVAIYAVAVTVGGGFVGPPMPPINVAIAPVPHAAAPPPATRAAPATKAATAAPPPDWSRRAEIAPPWDSR